MSFSFPYLLRTQIRIQNPNWLIALKTTPMSQPRKKFKSLSERVPNDIVFDILTQLPVKSIIRFRCVSKTCNSIITNPIFITTQFNLNQAKSLSNNNNNNNGYVLYTTPSRQLCMVNCNSYSSLTRFEIPFFDDCTVHFCNGMFCLHGFHKPPIILWNPSIRKYKMLPPTQFTDPFVHVSVGLAFHSQNNDFKILRIFCFQGSKLPLYEAEVYTLSTNSWRKVVISLESLNGCVPQRCTRCIFFNGALQCLVYTQESSFILSFDVSNERFREIMLPPNYLDGVFWHSERLAVFKGLLALIVCGVDLHEESGICHIWVMKKYGVVDSWTKRSLRVDYFV